LTLLGYWEMPEDDQPSEDIWLDDKALSEHFESVRAKYRSKYGKDSEDVPDAPMEQNELTASLRRR
jgi:hypothetical protein